MTTNQTTNDPTNAERQRRIRNRKSRAYTILKTLAIQLGAIEDHTDLDSLDGFMEILDCDAPIMDQLLGTHRR